MHFHSPLALTFLFSFFASTHLGAQESYELESLGTFGGAESYGQSISPNGVVVGYSQTPNTNAPGWQFRAWTWAEGIATDLPALTGSQTAAYDIDASRRIVGHSEIPTGFEAIYHDLWLETGPIGLGSLSGNFSQAFACNDAGQATGITAVVSQGMHYQAAFLAEQGTMTELPGLGGTFSTGRDINQVGVIVGQSNDASDLGRPVVWTNGSIALLSDDGLGGIAQGINDHGDVVGWIKGADGFNHAVMWNSDGRTDLGNLGGGNSFAYAINNQGVVVGNSDNWPTDAGPYAFVWQDGTMHDLAALVPAGLGGLSSLRVAHALNDAGQITGWAVNQAGDHEAFVVNPGHIQLFGLDVAVAGEGQRNIKVAQAAPGATVIAYYSTHSGLSSHHGVDLGLARARPFRATTVGPLGTAWLGAIFVPPSASGAMVWVQGIELPRTEMPQVTNLQALRFR